MPAFSRTLTSAGWLATVNNPSALQASFSGFQGLCLGASGTVKQNPEWSFNGAQYSRTAGIVTIANTTTDGDLYVGSRINVCAQNYPEIEMDSATILSVGHAASKMQLTYADPRPDLPNTYVTGTNQIHDLSRWADAGAAPAYLGMFGVPVDWTIMGAGSTNTADWITGTRKARIMAAINATRFDIVWLQGGLWGNYVGGNGQPASIAVRDLLMLLDIIAPNVGVVLLESPPANRNFAATTSNVAAAQRSAYDIARQVTTRYPNVVYCDINGAQSVRFPAGTDQDNAYPPVERFNDAAHEGDGGSIDKAHWVSRMLVGRLGASRLLGLNKSEDITRATGTDSDGNKVRNVRRAWFSPTPVTATAPATGNMPKGCRIDITNQGTGSVVSTIEANDVSGSDWRLDVTDSGNASGFRLVMAETGTDAADTANALLAQLNAAVGKKVRVNIGWALRGFTEGTVQYVLARLMGTFSGTTVCLTGLDDAGTEALSQTGKYLTEGRGGDMPCLVFTVPNVTFTAVELQIVVQAVASQAVTYTVVFDGKTQVIIES